VVTEPPVDYVAALCKPGKKCCFVASSSISVSQSKSESKMAPRRFDSQFCVTSNPADVDAGQFKAVFSKEKETAHVGDLVKDDDPSGIDILGELIEDVNKLQFAKVAEVCPVHVNVRRHEVYRKGENNLLCFGLRV
jgi:hypothetical protein